MTLQRTIEHESRDNRRTYNIRNPGAEWRSDSKLRAVQQTLAKRVEALLRLGDRVTDLRGAPIVSRTAAQDDGITDG